MKPGQKVRVIGVGIVAAVIIAVVVSMASTGSNYSDQKSSTKILVLPTDKARLDVELSLTPSPLEQGQETNLRMRFLQKDKDLTQEHIDYRLFVERNGSEIYETPLIHSNPGIVIATYTFPYDGDFIIRVDVEGVFFQPMPIETARFFVSVR